MENAKKVILAIDDNVQQLQEFKLILVPQYDLRVAKAASDALFFLNHNKADLILLDIGMPNVSGFEFLEDIKKILSQMDVPIIIITGNTGEEFLKEARASQANDVLTKPVKPAELLTTIEKHLSS